MIPGPVEVPPAVLHEMGRPPQSHVAPAFIERFGRVIEGVRALFRAPDGQPFVVAGSGTLAMEMAVVNLIEPGDPVLVVVTGYFGDRFASVLERFGARVAILSAEPGEVPPAAMVDEALDGADYRALFLTHVDTSTGVRLDIEPLAAAARARGVLTVVDGVCATAGERFEQTAWGVDLALTASQKAIGAPPGLALLVAGPQALATWRERRSPVAGYYADWGRWLPIMTAYEARRPSYFATPPVNLIAALDAALQGLLGEGMEPLWARHARTARAFRAAWRALGLALVPARPAIAANTMSALYYPEGQDSALLAAVRDEGVALAGGLHPALRQRSFRVGHMGPIGAGEILTTVGAIERALHRAGASSAPGAGLTAAQQVLAANQNEESNDEL